MTKHLLVMLMMGLALCLAGCTDDAGDEGGDAAPAEDAAAAPAEDNAPAVMEESGDAAAVTMAKLEGVEVEAGCVKCAYKMADACALGMKVGDKAYIVEGTDIISDDVGLCGATRPAKVTGEARDETHFVAANWEFTDE